MSLYDSHYNRVDVRFRHTQYDWMQMMVRTRDAGMASAELLEHERRLGRELHRWPTQRMSCRISAIFCPFPSMLSWLEAIATGVHRCSFGWDAEGPDIELEWRYNRLSISQPEDCYGKDGKKTWYQRELFVDANRRQVVAAFYTAFRRFAESSEYQPARYEDDLRGDEWTSLRIGKRLSPDALIGFLIGQSAALVEFFMYWVGLHPSVARCRSQPWAVPDKETLLRAFNGILPEAEIESHLKQLSIEGKSPVYRFVPAVWERMDASRRNECLREMLRWPVGHHSGSPLRTLRSERIESYLREPAVQQPKKSTMMKLFEVAPPPPEKPAAFEPAVELRKVISGGQTGADRAALDWAIERGYEHGGWCPRGRRAEDGIIDSRYQLLETESAGYMSRTKRNVRDSRGTLIVNVGELDGGTLQTLRYAERSSTPVFVAAADNGITPDLVKRLRFWAGNHWVATLNVAGPRESKRPGIYQLTRTLLDVAFSENNADSKPDQSLARGPTA